MPLLGISVLALLLLPLSLSCNSKRPPEEVQDHYSSIVKFHLDNTKKSITTSQNSTCPELRHKTRNCTPRHDNLTIVNILHALTCRMKNLRLQPPVCNDTEGLIKSVLNSIQCPCVEKLTKEPPEVPKRRTATRQRRNEQRKMREIKTLCKAEAVLSAMTECYELLNSHYSHYGVRPNGRA